MQDNNRKKPSPRGSRPDAKGGPKRDLPENLVVGRNAVMELVRSGAPVDKILAAGREGSVIAIIAEAKKRGIPVADATQESLDRIARGVNKPIPLSKTFSPSPGSAGRSLFSSSATASKIRTISAR